MTHVAADSGANRSFLAGIVGKRIPWERFDKMKRPGRTPHSPIFVVGSPRSGTTLVGRAIGAHPDVANVEESLFLTYFHDMIFDLHLGLGRWPITPLARLSTADMIEHVGAFADALLAGSANSQRHSRIVDHTPWYGAMAPLVDALFPGCVFVHVIRHGVAVVKSLEHSYAAGRRWAGGTVAERAMLWSTMVERCSEIGQHVASTRFVAVHYEQLCDDPTSTLKSLLSAIGLVWDPTVLLPLAEPHATPSRVNWRGPVGADDSYPDGWSAAEVAAFAAIAGDSMARLGYDCPRT
ncbi:sulfotransferase family protein [Dactylosporangium darangshiense]